MSFKNINSNNKNITKKCPYCNKNITCNKKAFGAHVKWCKYNPNFLEIRENFKNKLRIYNKDKLIEKYGPIKQFTVECYYCHTKFIVEEHEKKFPSKDKYYCSSKCKHKYSAAINILKNKSKWYIEKICPICNNKFTTRKSSKKEFCSKKCIGIYLHNLKKNKNIDLNIFKNYHNECDFKFSLKDFPEEFDFEIIKKYGWYKPKNHGNNLNGVSRDHMYSVMEGFKNHIDPKIISHPANCRLIKHNDNSSKKDKCCITLEQLKNKIIEWDKKYPKILNK